MVSLPDRLTGRRAQPPGPSSIQVGAEPAGHHAAEARDKLAELHGVAHLSPKETSAVLADKLRPAGAWFGVIVLLLIALIGMTLGGLLFLPTMFGTGATVSAGYAAGTLSWLISTAQAAPLLAIVTRLSFGLWAVPARRVGELFAFAGLVTTPLFWWLLLQRPAPKAWSGFWFGWPLADGWSVLAMTLLSLAGMMLLSLTALPDLSSADAGEAQRTIAGWRGSPRQWHVLEAGIGALGICYLALYVYVQLIVTTELALVLVPGWNSAVAPAQQVVSGLAGGVALTLVSLALICRAGAQHLVGLDPFWNGAKLLLGLAPISLYFTWAEALTYWYGRTPQERWLLDTLMFGPPLGLFLAGVLLMTMLPFAMLLRAEARQTYRWPVIAGGAVLVGTYLDRMRMFGVSWTVASSETSSELLALTGLAPGLRAPAPVDWLVMLSAPLIVALLVLAAAHWIPLISIWEYSRDRMYRVGRPFLETAIAIIGRPR
ncbi:MAG: hypothetical protein ACKVVP_17900 [Chloroflexota bacterium]